MARDTPERIDRAIEEAVATERKRCAAIVQAARFGEVDRDFRAIVHMIEGGQSAEALIEQAKPDF